MARKYAKRVYGTLYERFIAKVKKDDSGCWLWQAGLTPSGGYGQMSLGGGKEIVRAHVFSYEYYNGPVPKGGAGSSGICVCHKCDVPACVNPDHLFLGTQGDNIRDGISKGRFKQLSASMTYNRALEVLKDPRTYKEIAKDYGVTDWTIGRIKRRNGHWKDLSQ